MLLVGCAAIGVLLEISDPPIFFNFGALSAGATCTASKTLPGSERWCISAVSALFHGCTSSCWLLFSNRRAMLVKRARLFFSPVEGVMHF